MGVTNNKNQNSKDNFDFMSDSKGEKDQIANNGDNNIVVLILFGE